MLNSIIIIIGIIFGIVTLFIILERDTDYLALIFIFTTVFFIGILQMLGLPGVIVKFYRDLLIGIQFLKTYFKKQSNNDDFKFLGENIVIFFLLIAFVSLIYNSKSLLHYAVFLEDIIIFILFFWYILNIEIDSNEISKVNKYLIFLFIIQIPAAIIKFLIFGYFRESGGIGTFGVTAGSLSTVFPMLTTAFLLSFYLYTKNKKYIFFAIGFMAFGVLNAKRAIIIFIPIVAVINYILYVYYEKDKISYRKWNIELKKNIILVVFISFASFYFISRLNPSLNPDNKIWGSYDPVYSINYIVEYTTTEREEIRDMPRKDAPKYFYNVLKKKGVIHILIGMGPGDIIKSRFLKDTGINPILQKYGVRYGGRTAILWFFIQLGFIGAFIYFYFHYKIFKRLASKYKKRNKMIIKIICLASLSSIFVFFIDSVFYSKAMLKSGALMLPYFYFIGLLLQKNAKKHF